MTEPEEARYRPRPQVQAQAQAQPLPASYATHRSTLIEQTIRSLGLSVRKWKEPIATAVRSIPFHEWVDDLAQTSFVLHGESGQHSAPGPSNKLASVSAPSSSEKEGQPKKEDRQDPDKEESRYSLIRSIPNFQSYRSPGVLQLGPERDDNPPLAKKQRDFGFGRLRSMAKDKAPNGSDGGFPSGKVPIGPESKEDEAPLVDPKEQEGLLAGREGGRKVVLVICVLYENKARVEPDDRSEEVRWVPEEWAIGSGDEKTIHSTMTEDEVGSVVLPNNLRVDLPEPEKTEGRILFCSESVNLVSASPSSPLTALDKYHLLGGTLVVSEPEHPSKSESQKFRSSLEETLRIAIYTHAMNALEIALLKAHGHIPDPPLPLPILYERYTLPFNEMLSRSKSIDNPSSSRALDRESDDRDALGRRAWGAIFGRKRSAQKSNLLGGFWEAIVGQRGDSPSVRSPRNPNTSLTRVESEPAAPFSRGRTLESSENDQTAQSEKEGMEKEKEKKTQSKYSRLVHLFETTIFSTSPAVGPFPVPPIFLHLRETENQLFRPTLSKVKSSLFEESDDSDAPDASLLKGPGSESTDHNNSTYTSRWGEKAPEGLRLSAEARSGLSAFNWINLAHCSESNGGFGPDGFWKQQSIAVLYAINLHKTISSSADVNKQSADPLVPAPSSAVPDQSECTPPTLIHLPYSFTSTSVIGHHSSLGGFIRAVSDRASKGQSCGGASCGKPEVNHVRIWIHGGVKIEGKCAIQRESMEGSDVSCWVACRICGKKSEDHRLSPAALQVPFGKYLEMLVYSDYVLQPTVPLCPHTVPLIPKVSSTSPYIAEKIFPNLLRHFSHQNVLITFALSAFDIYETSLSKLVPKSKIIKASIRRDGSPGSMEDTEKKRARLRRKRLVKREVEGFYEILEERIDMLKERLSVIIRMRTQSSKAPDAIDDPALHYAKLHKLLKEICTEKDELLVCIHESSLKAGRLNDVRRMFMQKSRDAAQKLSEWEETEGLGLDLGNLSPMDLAPRSPKYFSDKNVHALPGSSVLYKEDQPASLIAHALSSTAYIEELSKSQSISIGPSLEISSPRTSILSSSDLSTTLLKKTVNHVSSNPCFAPPHCSTALSRADHAKDFSTALFSLRRRPSDSFLSITPASNSALHDERSNHPLGTQKSGNDPTISFAEAEGQMISTSRGSLIGSAKGNEKNSDEAILDVQKLHRLLEEKGTSMPISVSRSTLSSSIESGNVTPGLSVPVSPAAHQTLLKRSPDVSHTPNGPPAILEEIPPPLSTSLNQRNISQSNNQTSLPTPPLSAAFGLKGEGWTSSLTSALGGSVSAVLQYGSGNARRKPSVKTLSSSRTPSMHNLLGSESQLPTFPIEPKPHVHLVTTIGSGTNKKREITCIIYYATAFEALRRELGVDISIIESLENTNLWDAQGGKSKAAFFKTTDDKFVVKELVSKWNISDIQGLLDIAPAYFDFILGSGSGKPTSLAKIVGFYTCKVHDLDTKQTRKLDLLVMENLFYKQTISKTFDLKGIEGRRFKTVLDGHPQLTLGHDLDWVEGLKAIPLLIHPYEKSILHDAISNDARFLSTNFVMDYSLLVGIDETRQELAVGIVDAIGAFTLLKALESKGKQLTRKDGSDITVIPPDQYRARFEHAMESYFLVCPDRFSSLGPGPAGRSTERVYPVLF